MKNMIRAKFKLTRIEISSYSNREMRTLVFNPVYSNDPNSENKAFWDATPVGEVRLGTVNPEAWKNFELDHEYYLDFSPAVV